MDSPLSTQLITLLLKDLERDDGFTKLPLREYVTQFSPLHNYPVFSTLPIPADGIRAPPVLEAGVRRACWAVFHVRLVVAVADVVIKEAVGRLGSRAHLPAELLVSVQRILEGIRIQPYLAIDF